MLGLLALAGCDGGCGVGEEPPPPDFPRPPPRPTPTFDGSILARDAGPPPDAGMPDAGRCPSHDCTGDAALGCPFGSGCLPVQPERVIVDDGTTRCVRPETPGWCEPDGLGRACSLESRWCGECGVCGADGPCRRRCDPSLPGRGGCPSAQRCDWSSGTCVEGCLADCECQTRVDEWGALRFDPEARSACDTTTGRCVHYGGTARIGDPCERDAECPPLAECETDWPGGGHCTLYGCAGRTCSADAACHTRLRDVSFCARGCPFAAELGDETLAFGPAGHGEGCREGYACVWNGDLRAGTPDSGICFPGLYNARREPNIGAPCDGLDPAADCWSPLGLGFCTASPDGWCSVRDCAVPGLPSDFCGPVAVCRFVAGIEDLSICLPRCETDADCPAGLPCTDSGGDRICSR